MQHKVLAYVLRAGQGGGLQLLVFDHSDQPEAGTQVPAGTVEPGEAIEAALWRELHEESGLASSDVRLVGKLAADIDEALGQQRHVFQLAATRRLSDRWRHRVAGQGEDEAMQFDFFWINVTPALGLAGWQAQWLGLLAGPDA